MAYKKILFRRDLAATWTSVDPVLSAGEIGLESDTGKIKLGDGTSSWTELDYFYGSLDSTSYVQSLVAGTGLTITGNSGSGSTPTISIPQSVATTASPTFAQATINNLPVDDKHVATKAYVDGIAASINWHEFATLATDAALPNNPTYDNSIDGIGATLTAGANARLVVDGTNASTGNRILVKNQANAVHNGVYWFGKCKSRISCIYFWHRNRWRTCYWNRRNIIYTIFRNSTNSRRNWYYKIWKSAFNWSGCRTKRKRCFCRNYWLFKWDCRTGKCTYPASVYWNKTV
jgi:hypothetical protein